VIIVTCIGYVVFLNTFRMKTWLRNIFRGNAYIIYDGVYIYMICFAFWVIPNVLERLKIKYIILSYSSYGDAYGTTYYLFIYPLLDLSMESVMDIFLHVSQHAELFVH
jgi:hypothetical protein